MSLLRPLLAALLVLAALLAAGVAAAAAPRVLFIGNSFTFAAGTALRFWRAGTVTDLNGEGTGGVPALFKSFVQQAGLDHEVYLETRGGSGLDWHLQHRLALIDSRPWDRVVMHGYSTLDAADPGNPALLVRSVRPLAEALRRRNADVTIYLMATWSRADQNYPAGTPWHGKPIAAMADDVRAGYDRAAAGVPGIAGVIPVGQAWNRAIAAGVADGNPYDGIGAGLLDLWGWDHYHASLHGHYLQALVIFGMLTGRDPRTLGEAECSAFELGLSPGQARALQQVAFDELAQARVVTAMPQPPAGAAEPQRCALLQPAGR
ncbi:MAG: PEP-CTERM sorting domain-containing protein [Proteobacteria bacterium]|nr:PEP-CTERM sorting domain-containing protein [Pseudomonadota bacterium]